MNIGETVGALREGKRLRRRDWNSDEHCPAFIVFIPSREIAASYRPMADHLGEGTRFDVAGHVDALYQLPNGGFICQVGYAFTQSDVFASDWEIMD